MFARTAARAFATTATRGSGCGARAALAVPATSARVDTFRPFQAQQCRPLSTGKKKIVDVRRDVQRDVWESYLSGNSSSDNLFMEIDLNKSGAISVIELNYWLESVNRSGVSDSAFQQLQKLGEDHELDRKEFEMWLNMATYDAVRADKGESRALADDSSSESSGSSTDEDDAEQPSAGKKNVVDARRGLQRQVWETFLATGTHGSDLFRMIDLNRNGLISVLEITYFVESVDTRGVDAKEFSKLKMLGEDHQLEEKEFLDWLASATGIEPEKMDTTAEESANVRHSTRSDAEGCTPGHW